MLQIFAACPAPLAAAMDDALAHLRQNRLGLRKRLVGAAGHEGQRRGLGAADAAGDRRIERQQAALACAISCALRALSTSMVEQSMTSAPAFAMRKDVRPDREHVLAGRQHGDDHIRVRHGLRARTARLRRRRPAPAGATLRQRSKPFTRCPALTRLTAMGPPMLPRPMKAMVAMMCSALWRVVKG